MRHRRKSKGRSSIAAALAIALLVTAGTAYAKPPSDYWITTKTKIALLTAKNVSGSAINVDTVDGIVSLHGTVGSDNDRLGAERVAREIEGVRDVRNLVQVVPEEPRQVERMRKNERELIDEVSAALKDDPGLAGSSISVKSAAGGVVLLTGKAESASRELQAIQVARSVDGVDGVMSEIQTPAGRDDAPPRDPPATVKREAPAPGEERGTDVTADAWITAKTKMALVADSTTPANSINVDTVNGVVTLFGKVPSREASSKAERIAKGIDGVREVRNKLEVEGARASTAP